METEKSGRCIEVLINKNQCVDCPPKKWPLCGDPTVFHSEVTFVFFIFKCVDEI